MRKQQHESSSHVRKGDGVVQAHTSKKIVEVDDVAITNGLAAIYGEERDDLRTVAKAPNSMTRFLVRAIAVLFVLCVLTGIGYATYSYWFAGNDGGKPLEMTFVVSDDIQSGSETTLELDYRNQTGYPLTSVTIDLNVPAGFIPISAEPAMTNEEDLSWDFGTIGARSDGKILLTGTWFADVPSTTGIQALASYKPANFNAQFHDIAVKTVSTTTSTTAVLVEAPQTVNVGEEMTYTIRINTSGTSALVAPQVIATLPEGFFIASSVPALEPGGSTTWTLADLVPGVEQTVVIVGAFASDAIGIKTISVSSGVAGTRFSPQATATAAVDVQPSILALTMVGNGSTGSLIADPGSVLRLSLRLDNTSDAEISNVSALLDFTAEDNLPISWTDAVLDGGRVTAKGIDFSSGVLGSIPANDHIIFNLSFPLKTDLSAVSSAFSIAFSATRGLVTVYATPLNVALNSDAGIRSTLLYYDDDGTPLGSGPLPPVVGSTTHYRAVWTIATGSHGLRDVSVSAALPEGIVWDDFSSATSGVVSYDESTRAVRWVLSNIPAGTTQVSARMSIAFTPVAADLGLEKTVLGKIVLQAKDESTGAVVERTADAVTTACDGDAFAIGNGQVR
ncbi:MAG: hypothetical protein WCT28_04395 [Patescibacteria group bacterium]|jgi:uncharacterized repeat protein (TIGR01451 family)